MHFFAPHYVGVENSLPPSGNVVIAYFNTMYVISNSTSTYNTKEQVKKREISMFCFVENTMLITSKQKCEWLGQVLASYIYIFFDR